MTTPQPPLRHAQSEVVDARDTPGLIGVDGSGVIWRWDDATERIFGRTAAQMVGRSVASIALGQPVDVLAWMHNAVAAGDLADTLKMFAARPDHWAAPISLQVSALPPAIYAQPALIVVRRLGPYRPEPQTELATLRRRVSALEAMLDNSPAASLVFNDRMIITQVGNTSKLPSGWEPGDFIGKPALDFVHQDDRARIEVLFSYVIAHPGSHPPLVVKALTPRGEPIWVEARLTNLLDSPELRGVIGTFVNVTNQLIAEDQVRHLTFHDPLTGLGNRTLLDDRLAHARAGGGFDGDARTLVLVDLCDLGTVNARLGHRAGDQVLCSAAERLRRCAAAADADAVVRLAGDQFAVLHRANTERDAVGFARSLLDGIAGLVNVGDETLPLQASAGVVVVALSENLDEVLRRAGLALARARLRGRGNVEFFTTALEAESTAHNSVVTGVRDLDHDRDLHLVYQPIVDLRSGNLIGAEALLRWTHPTLGAIPPAVFISVAETSGAIVDIGRWVLRKACESAARWGTFDGRPIALSVNVSARQLESPAFVDDVIAALSDAGLEPQDLVLEVTETAVLENHAAAVGALTVLAERGVRIAIDDFGTGYATLTYLKQWPVDIIKIDRSFIAGLGIDEHDTAIVANVVNLGYALGVQVTAEGVETTEQRDQLIALGCTHGQGFLFGKPNEELVRGDQLSA
jgi:diguanylate cyclase (GGDEF)-like protein/PAS domain S-box-containing protein